MTGCVVPDGFGWTSRYVEVEVNERVDLNVAVKRVKGVGQGQGSRSTSSAEQRRGVLQEVRDGSEISGIRPETL
jgi:hypothetical protein